jgi:hypothetical protein
MRYRRCLLAVRRADEVKDLHRFVLMLPLFLAVAAHVCAQSPTESTHRRGPHGLEGWTLSSSLQGRSMADVYPYALIIARDGKIIRRVEGGPFLWKWLFWAEGKQIAYQTGPLHFGLLCNLADLATGKELASADCYHELPPHAPAWAAALEAQP